MKFIIEHMEPKVSEWCLIEYRHISQIVGRSNLLFTNVANKSDQNKLKELGEVHKEPIAELGIKKACLLDMDAEKELQPIDKTKFDYFIFGGILGDNPRQHRTRLLKNQLNIQTRNLTNKQMSTDTAVYAAKKVLGGAKLGELRFADEVEIIVEGDEQKGESVVLPFRYIIDNDELILPEGLIDYLKKKKTI